MRRFRFRLERLRWYRELQTELAQQALGIARQEEQRVAGALSAVQAQADDEAVALRRRLEEPLEGADLALHTRYVTALEGHMHRLEREREERRGVVAERREAFRERRRGFEAVEGLRRQASQRYRREVERDAQGYLDEIAGVRAARLTLMDSE